MNASMSTSAGENGTGPIGRGSALRARARLYRRVALWRTGLGGWPVADGLEGLAELEASIARDAPDVARLAPAELQARLAGACAPLIVDVRSPAEFRVSRIPSSRPLSDGMPSSVAGGVVLVCSIGLRSALMAMRLMSAGGPPHPVWNLSGGIFRWHGEGLPLVDDGGETTAVHPYAARWSRFIEPTAIERKG